LINIDPASSRDELSPRTLDCDPYFDGKSGQQSNFSHLNDVPLSISSPARKLQM
jgi:hypothetical protein